MASFVHIPNESMGSDGDALSHSDSVNVTGQKAGEKREVRSSRTVSRAGTRSVSNLSPAQLERKRANDREAQRNIRARTKGHIEQLEATVEEERRRSEALERVIKDLNESLAQLRLWASNRLNPDRSTGRSFMRDTKVSSSSARDFDRENSTSVSSNSQGFNVPLYQNSAASTNLNGIDRHSFSMAFGPLDVDGGAHALGPASTNALDESNSLSYFNVNFNDAGNWIPRSIPHDAAQSPDPSTLLDLLGHTNRLPRIPQTLSSSITPSGQGIPTLMQPFEANHGIGFPSSRPVQAWDLPILNISTPTCGVDNILINTISTQKQIAQQGAPVEHIIGPIQPSMKALIYPTDPNQTHIVSTAISELLTNLAIKGLPERAGCLYLMYHICQWQIYPSSSTYGNLTDWSSPRTSQLITPHPAWTDSIFWGKLKDKVIENQNLYANDEFQNAYILCINANWPRPDLEAFRFEGNDIFITEEFENHIKCLSNWSLDERFAAKYPELAPLVKISEVGSGGQAGSQGLYAV